MDKINQTNQKQCIKTKTCSCCKKTYPATIDYFYKKVTKAGTVIGKYVSKKDYVYLKNLCKVCNGKKGVLRAQKKRAKELNISLEEYQKNADKIGRAETRIKKLKYIEFKDLPSKERAKKVRMLNKGYTMKDLENYNTVLQEKRKEKCIKSRKYDYSEFGNMYPLTTYALNKKYIEKMVPCRIALSMKIPVKHLTPQLLELGVKSVSLHRQIKSLITN